jgi:amino acid transporter
MDEQETIRKTASFFNLSSYFAFLPSDSSPLPLTYSDISVNQCILFGSWLDVIPYIMSGKNHFRIRRTNIYQKKLITRSSPLQCVTHSSTVLNPSVIFHLFLHQTTFVVCIYIYIYRNKHFQPHGRRCTKAQQITEIQMWTP